MRDIVAKFDALAGLRPGSAYERWLCRITFFFLILMVLAVPHSISASQTAWIIGSLALIARLLLIRRLPFRPGMLDAALWAFFAWSVVSSLVSYEPLISLDKLRGAAVFLVFYFVLYSLRNRGAAGFLAFLLIGSCMVNVMWVPVERMIGRGVEIDGLQPDSPLAKALLWDGDTLLEVNGRSVNDLNGVVEGLRSAESSKVKFYRPDFEFTVEVQRSDILDGPAPLQALGITGWKKSRNWRSSGFYGHYATYAEVLQLIGSLALGLLLAFFGQHLHRKRSRSAAAALDDTIPDEDEEREQRSHLLTGLLLGISVVGIAFALLLTLTRAPQLALVISAFTMILLSLGKRRLIVAVLIMVPIAIGALVFLERSRHTGFIDPKDESTQYRQMMIRDGLRLWTKSPRHFVFGVGMDSIKVHWQEWAMFDGGRQPLGHFHSTPLQLLIERGLPALLLWLIILGVYARSLWIGVRQYIRIGSQSDWVMYGILLGCVGGTIGFFVSGFVHYNFGDQEAAMVFFILMAFGIRIVSDDEALSAPGLTKPASQRVAA
ncbi:MAG TPA: O-antigen ligase family protein [Pyrinomonadaceae bacterium]|nr:O-antigen ligase family protein [Pyrinomonadaceae bacterium]